MSSALMTRSGGFSWWGQGVRAGPDDALVPVPGLPEHLVGQVPDPVADRLLALAGRDDAARDDLVEQRHRVGLGIQQLSGSFVLGPRASAIGQVT